jgi:hypothetical protein
MVEAYNVEGDVREVNIPTFEPDLSTSFDDLVPWDVMPTGMSDILTQIYGSADFQSAIKQLCLDFADIFCREVKSEPARVEPWKVDIDWDKWRIPKNGGPPRPQSTKKMEETRSKIMRMLELDLIEPSKLPYYSHVHLVRKPTEKWRFYIDFRTINDLCGNIGWPIPNFAQTLERIGPKKPKVFAKFDLDGVLSDGLRPEYSRRYIVHLPGRGIPMETYPDGMEERGSALPTTVRGSLKRTIYTAIHKIAIQRTIHSPKRTMSSIYSSHSL